MIIIETLKKYIPIGIKRKIKLLFTSVKNSKWEQFVSKEHKNIFIFLAGFYQNFGDMAITYAQSKFLKEIYPDATIVLVPSIETYTAVKAIRNLISEDDIITITGGGNMDDAYPSLEDARLHVLRSFPNNKVICFPQTMSYSDSKKGIKRMKISCSVYSKHQNLFLFAREKESYKRMKESVRDVTIGCCPDIVLYLDKLLPKRDRKSVTCCFRSDKEKNLPDVLREEIFNYLKKKSVYMKCVDTIDVAIEDCIPERYEDILEQFWSLIKESRLVITDRLHCMIFCVITGTPCIALDNSNHKIRGVYETWLHDISYVKVVYENRFDEIIQNINCLLDMPSVDKLTDFSKQFDNLRKACSPNV